MSSFCVKCKKASPDVNPQLAVTKNGRNMVKSKCGNCGSNKCQFVSGNSKPKPKKGKGLGRVIRGVLGSIF